MSLSRSVIWGGFSARRDQREGRRSVNAYIQIYSPPCSSGSARDCEHLQRAYNLKTAYEGVLAIGCPELKDGNGGVFQSIAPAGEPNRNALGIQAYGCFAERTGCRSNADCRAGGAGTACYCYGASCLDQGEGIAGTDLLRTRVRGSQEGGFRQGVNNSCLLRGSIRNLIECSLARTPRVRIVVAPIHFHQAGRRNRSRGSIRTSVQGSDGGAIAAA